MNSAVMLKQVNFAIDPSFIPSHFSRIFNSNHQLMTRCDGITVRSLRLDELLSVYNHYAQVNGRKLISKKMVKSITPQMIMRYKLIVDFRVTETFERDKCYTETTKKNKNKQEIIECNRCNGRGTARCRRCEVVETAWCEDCCGSGFGNGSSTCGDCEGFGEDSCPWCQEKPRSCNKCRGSGKMIRFTKTKSHNESKLHSQVYEGEEMFSEEFLHRCRGSAILTHQSKCDENNQEFDRQAEITKRYGTHVQLICEKLVMEVMPVNKVNYQHGVFYLVGTEGCLLVP